MGVNTQVELTTNIGAITIELDGDKAPITVQNFLAYVGSGFYDGTIFHRVIANFMIQGGGLEATLQEKWEGQLPPIRNESTNGLRNDVGTVAMARTSEPNSATSQFFINVRNNDFLNKDRAQDGVGYAVFGKVVAGMDIVRRIATVRTGTRGATKDVPVEPITIVSARVVTS
jgi:peptidyl-prolyl cis-trans isomerase B (cyclophilin B)